MTAPRKPDPKIETIAASASVGADNPHAAMAPPLVMSSTYAWRDLDERPAFDYSRSANPTRAALADALARMEGGAGAIVTSSGMSAIDLALHMAPAGARVMAPHDCYGGAYRLLEAKARLGHLAVDFVDQGDDAAFEAALSQSPALVLLETPSNPLFRVVDLARRAAQIRAAGAVSIVDNTFLTPARQRPLALGCDVVVHSTTKFLNGHSDVIGGALICADAARHEDLCWWANTLGVTGGAFDAYQTLRGVRTLAARLDAQERTAIALAHELRAHPGVSQVYFPGLADHPDAAIIARQQSGPGAVFSFTPVGGADAARRFLEAVSLMHVGASLGGFETIACLPAVMTHAGMPEPARARAGLDAALIRISVGLEHVDDLRDDFAVGLRAAAGASGG